MRGRAEAEEPDAIATFHAGHPQAPESDNARAEQRRCVQVIQTVGQREHEIRSRQGKLGEPAIDRVPRESRRIAEILQASMAIRACPIDAAHPGDSHSCPEGKPRRGPVYNLAHNLVAWD